MAWMSLGVGCFLFLLPHERKVGHGIFREDQADAGDWRGEGIYHDAAGDVFAGRGDDQRDGAADQQERSAYYSGAGEGDKAGASQGGE